MKKITLTHSRNHRIGFSKVRKNASEQICSYCGKVINSNTFSLTINEYIGNGWNCRIHLNCINEFCNEVKKFYKEKKVLMVMESI